MNGLEAAIKGNEAAIDKYKNSLSKVTNESKGITTNISEQKKKLSELKTAYIDANAKYGEHSNEAESLKQKIKELSAEIAKEEETIKEASEAADSFDQSMKKVDTKVSESKKQFSELASTLRKGLVNGAKAAISAFEKYVATAVTAGTALATAGLKTYSSFESSMSQVQATMGITSDAMSELNGKTVNTMEALSDLATQMGAETSFSAVECADALNYLALAGYNTQEIYDTLPTVLNLAAAGNIDLASASDMVTDAMSALGMKTEDADIMVDQMAKTASSTNTSVSELGDA
ncbi:MAG: phage tail tape measure protein, partial [Ruminococcus sp.]|nr:phage tail tape measure protein [Ruminococcus sp.]